jgi:hypothetical protein
VTDTDALAQVIARLMKALAAEEAKNIALSQRITELEKEGEEQSPSAT